MPKNVFLGFSCAGCGRAASTADQKPFTISSCCGRPLKSTYDFELARSSLGPPRDGTPPDMWRYRAILPLHDGFDPVSLGEGGTPLLRTTRLGAAIGLSNALLKDESANPTGSFKDRGMSVAVSLARSWGVPGIVLPTAGNAGAAAAAYGRAADLEVSIHAPETTPREILSEIRFRDVGLTLHPGSIADAGHHAGEEARARSLHSVATFKEPGRVEGKKTMGYELREQLGRAPDAIVYPCGGGTGIVAMRQAFDEMESLGWIGSQRPRLFAVQAEGCSPVVKAFVDGRDAIEPPQNPTTLAAGLRVPTPFADREILSALRDTGGAAITVSEQEILEAGKSLARTEGILASPEGAAAAGGAAKLRAAGLLRRDDCVVIFQTGSGLKYLDAWAELEQLCCV